MALASVIDTATQTEVLTTITGMFWTGINIVWTMFKVSLAFVSQTEVISAIAVVLLVYGFYHKFIKKRTGGLV